MKEGLKIRGLSLSFAGLKALEDVSFDVPPGAIVGLIGPNGAGKSSLLNCLSRLYTPNQGQLHYQGVNLLEQPVHRLAALGIMRTFQNLEMFPEASALDNVLTGSLFRHRVGLLSQLLTLPRARRAHARAREEARSFLGKVALEHLADTPVGELAFGTQKNIELARALAGQPSLLLLDEPAAGMNPQESQWLGERIRRIRDELSTSVLLVEHDMRLVMSVCEHIVVLVQGRKVFEGTPAEVRCHPLVIEAYLGEEEHAAA